LVTGGLDGDPEIMWDIDPASWREKACTVAGRNMTKAEWRKYMPRDEPYGPTCPGLAVESQQRPRSAPRGHDPASGTAFCTGFRCRHD
jgi:hypothetical protein